MSRLFLIILCSGIGGLYMGCEKDPQIQSSKVIFQYKIPAYFPEASIPSDNLPTSDRIALGRLLFYERALSLHQNISCSSCHLPAKAFADSLPKSLGSEGLAGVRNSISLANVMFQPYLLREGSVPTLEMQILVPIQEHLEFNHNILAIVDDLKNREPYNSLSLKAYNRPFDAWVLTRSIACFERSLISAASPYDGWLKGDKNALSEAAEKGRTLFFDSLYCGKCHAGVLLTDFSFANNGLYEAYNDIGRERFTKKAADRALFKTPSLRNVSLTAPYMHDGSIKTLEEVLNHYSSGGQMHPNKSEIIKPFSLSRLQKDEILAFLESLSDEEFVHNRNFQKP